MISFLKKIAKFIVIKRKFPASKIPFSAQVSLDTILEKGVKIGEGAKLGSCNISRYTYIGNNSQFERVIVGPFCSVGKDVVCGLGAHPLDFASTYPGFYTNKVSGSTWFGSSKQFEDKPTVTIGADVWIGTRAIILGGIEIGIGAVVATGAIVTKNVPPYAIVGGVPAKIIRYRFTPVIIQNLLDSKWWTLSDDKIKEISKYIDNVDEFVKKTE